MKRNVVPMPPGIHAGLLHREARSWVKATRVIGREFSDPKQITEMVGPIYFPLCHGLELALKAVLAAKGYSKYTLSQVIGHDLKIAYKKAKADARFPSSDALLEKLIQLMASEHKKHRFRYPGTIWLQLPNIDQCCDAVDRLLDQTKVIVDVARTKAALRLALKKLAWDPDLEPRRPLRPRRAAMLRKIWNRQRLGRNRTRVVSPLKYPR